MPDVQYTTNPMWVDVLRQCYHTAKNSSHDPKTQNGAILCVGRSVEARHLWVAGANELPASLAVTEERLTPDIKGPLIVHAEVNAIVQAARKGYRTYGATLVCCWAPCIRCASTIIQAGITQVVAHKQMHDRTYDRYVTEIETAIAYLQEAGVSYMQYDGHIGDCVNTMNGETWSP